MSSLVEDVAELIRQFRESKDGASINWLSKRSGVPYSTVRGIAQKEVKDANTANIVAILSVFMKSQDIIALLKKYGRDEKLRAVYSAQANCEIIDKTGFQWKSPDHAILALAATDAGTTRVAIEQDYGKESGLKRLEALLEQGLLREINGAVKTFSRDFTDPDLNSVAKQIEIHAQTWDHSQIEKGGFSHITTRDLSKPAFEEIKDVLSAALNKVFVIIESDKDNPKDVVMLLNFLCSVYGGSK